MFHRLKSVRVLSGLLIASSAVAVSVAADWPTFRGPQRTAVSPETGLLQEWPADGPPMLWKTEGLGRGYSSLAISGGKIYTLGDGLTEEDKDEYLLCYDQNNGQLLWKVRTGTPWTGGKPDWQGPRSTPTVDGERVYALTAEGDLVCCSTGDGSEQWRKNLKTDFGGQKADNWGYSESVLIDGDLLVCTPGNDQATMVAMHKTTGEVVWKSIREGDRGAGHSSIVITDIAGTKVYVQDTGSGSMGVRASDGHLLWKYDVERTTAVIPTPIVRGDLVFFVAGYKRGGALLQQVPGADGAIDIKELYPLQTKLANKHGGVVLVGDYLYGDSDDAGVPYCADLLTGEVKWQKRGSGKGSAAMIAADGRLYIQFANGTMVLAKASPEEYVEVGAFTIPGSGDRPSWAHPVIADGKLYVREHNSLLCFDIQQK